MVEDNEEKESNGLLAVAKRNYGWVIAVIVLVVILFFSNKIVIPEYWFWLVLAGLAIFLVYKYFSERKAGIDAYHVIEKVVRREYQFFGNRLDGDSCIVKESPVGSGIYLLQFLGDTDTVANLYRYDSVNNVVIWRAFDDLSEVERQDRSDKNLSKIFDSRQRDNFVSQISPELEEKGYELLEKH